jgi:hypothetical protein
LASAVRNFGLELRYVGGQGVGVGIEWRCFRFIRYRLFHGEAVGGGGVPVNTSCLRQFQVLGVDHGEFFWQGSAKIIT